MRQVGFDPIQQEQMVFKFIQAHCGIKREEAMALCRLNKDQAYRLLKKLANTGVIRFEGKGKGGKDVLSA